MKRRHMFMATLLTAGLTMTAYGAPTAFAATSKPIKLDGKTVATVPSLVDSKTTYMPIWYVMQVLKQLGIKSHWNGHDHDWSLTVAGKKLIGHASKGTGDTITVNGQQLYRVRGIVSHGTTYMPIWYVMQMLKQIGIGNTWNGKEWDITGTSALLNSTTSGTTTSTTNTTGDPVKDSVPATSASTSTPSTSTGTSLQAPAPALTLPNAATDDSSYWQRAGKSLFIDADSYSSLDATSGPPIFTIKPGDDLNLTLASGQKDITTAPTWFVNSPDATVAPGPANWTFTYGNHTAQHGTFSATKPGIYTVQAKVNGEYSEPLVILVGINQLQAPNSLAVDGKSYGIQPLPSGLPQLATQTQYGVTYEPYPASNGWLPLSGTASNTSAVTVYMIDGNQDWTYVLPVKDGHFSGMIRIPFTGTITVSFYKDFNGIMNSNNGNITYSDMYQVTNNVDISRQDKALLASGEEDINMTPDAVTEASILMQNAPSQKTGIMAIANYVGEKVSYDWKDYLANTVPWKDSATVWQSPLGVCQDISMLTTTMLRSIGIPTETVSGNADGPHEWVQAYDGSSWFTFDPTWDTPTETNSAVHMDLSNEYNDNSTDMLSSHQTQGTGGWH